MQAAEHGADFAMARKVRSSMTHDQMHDFAVGSESGKPQHVRKMTRSSESKRKRDVESGGAMLGHPARNLGKYHHPKGGY
jgi:hypothetical protein